MRWLIAILAGCGLARSALAVEPAVYVLPDGALVAVPTLGATVAVAGRPAVSMGGWATARVPAGPATAAIHRGGRQVSEVSLPDRSATTARLVLAGRWNWPDEPGLLRMQATLGGPVQAVVALGDAQDRIGYGGWEARIPIIAMGLSSRGGPMAQVLPEWNGVVTWGPVGFPMASSALQIPERALRAQTPWRIPVLTWTPWDAGSRSNAQDPTVIRLLIIAAKASGAPLLLAPGDGCGLLSHPLGDVVVRDRPPRMGAIPSGLRYLAVDGGGDLPDHLDPMAATVWEQPLLIGLVADADALTISAVAPTDGALVWSITWTRHRDGAVTGTGPGSGNQDVLTRTWRAAGDGATAALEALAWYGPLDVERLNPTAAEIASWIAGGDPVSHRMAARLAEPSEDLLRGRIRLDIFSAPDWFKREAVLRNLHQDDLGLIQDWAGLAERLPDPAVERALLRRAAVDAVHQILLARVLALANQRLALDPDPVAQHRLITAVVDDPRTGNRARTAIRALRERLTPLARGPADRYLARTAP